jgi:hypothetical protein
MSSEATVYLAKDFNFNHYSVKDLDLICNYRLPILTDFPKSVLYIYYEKLDVILDENNEYSENEIILKIINSINKIQNENIKQKNISDVLDFSEEDFDSRLSSFFREEVVDFIEKKRLSKKKKSIM